VNDELDPLRLGDTDLPQSSSGVGADGHGEVAEVEHSDRVAVSVEHVVVGDLVLAS
jgi:hypothetical protein